MSFLYPWIFFLFVLGNNIFLKVALLWSGNLKYPNACFPRWSQPEELPPSLDVPGLGLARIFLWTELHVPCLLAGGKRVGGSSRQSCAHNIRAVASFEADVLCLYTAASVVSSLCLLLSHARPHLAVTSFILPLEPQSQVCFRLLENRVGLDLEHSCPQLECLLRPRGENGTPDS